MTAAFRRFYRNRSAQLNSRANRQKEIANHVAGRRQKNSSRRARLFKLLLRIGVAAFVLLVIVVGSLFAYLTKDLPDSDGIKNRAIAESTKIYARDGSTVLYEIFDEERRTSIPFEEIPEAVKEATVAIEDDDFYKHHGIDFSGIARAVYKNLTGGSTEGGSTITQQLVKNAILTSERTFTRKVKELILSIEIESRFSKDDILKLYLNEIPYGRNAYGIQAAAKTYFNKDAKDLTLSESALLAALPQRPSYFAPDGPHKEELNDRKNYVLERMAKLGMITEEEAEKAKAEPLKFVEPKIEIKAPHFVFWVKDQLIEKYGEQIVERGGLRVTTTLDPKLQTIAERAVTEGAKRNFDQYGVNNAALVSVDPRTGQVLAHVGSKDYFNDAIDGSVDIPNTLQQPGSSFKMFEYTKMLEKGYPRTTILFDVERDFGGNYKPKNYSKGQMGPVTLESALQMSLNLPAVEATYLAGVDQTIDLAKAMGITDLNDRANYGLAIGLGAGEVKLVDHTAAFAVLANQGKKIPQSTILKVVDPSGKVLEEWQQPGGEQVVQQNVALTMSDILSNDGARAPVFGSGGPLTLPGRRAAAKSGTTESNTDGLAMGYVPQMATGVWVGNNDNTPFPGGDGSYTAAPIWHQYMTEALKGYEPEWYPAPEPMPAPKAILAGRAGGKGEKVKVSKIDGKLAPGGLPEDCIEEKEFVEYHSTLHYVAKDDPLGPAPANPASDPMYTIWENAVRAWSRGKAEGAAPKETSPYGPAEVQPKISILSPAAGTVITTNSITAIASATAAAGIQVVDFALDGGIVGSSGAEPFSVTFAPNLPNGFHTITAVATAKCGGKAETSIDVQIQIDSTAPTAAMTISSVAGLVVSVDGSGSSDNSGITSYAWDFGDGSGGSGVTSSHTYTAPGNYTVTLTVTDAAGQTGSTSMPVTII
jgi:1A family penicillin-binding protein